MGKTTAKTPDLQQLHKLFSDSRANIVDASSRAAASAVDEAYQHIAGFALESGEMVSRMTIELKFDFTAGRQSVAAEAVPMLPEALKFECSERVG